MTFSSKARAAPTRMPAVWAMPSIMRLAGMTGKPGKWSCRCSSASDTFLMATAETLTSNFSNLSIQIQRIVVSCQCQKRFALGWPVHLTTDDRSLTTHSPIHFRHDIPNERIDGEDIAEFVDI